MGSIKSTISYLKGTGGVDGVIKAILSLEKEVIPLNIWFEYLNSNINATNLSIEVIP